MTPEPAVKIHTAPDLAHSAGGHRPATNTPAPQATTDEVFLDLCGPSIYVEQRQQMATLAIRLPRYSTYLSRPERRGCSGAM